MNHEFLNQLAPENRNVSDALDSQGQSIQVNPEFQSNLESRLKQAHPANKQPTRGVQARVLSAVGWAILIIGAILLLNWAVRALVPDLQPAANGTPDPDASFESDVTTGNICTGQLAVVHDFSVFLSNQDKSSFLELDEARNIDELRSFAWSPDGSQLAIVGNTRGSGNLYLTDPAGTQLQPILSNSELAYLMGVAWSHDGRQLLTWEIENNKRLYLLNKDGTGLTEIDLPLQFFETPQFAPDDKSIMFYGADASTDGLFRVTIDGLQVKLISDLVKSESSFAWSPDGSRLAYIEMTSGSIKARIVMDSETDETAPVTHPIYAGNGSPSQDSANLSWSPDGKSLAHELIGSGAHHIVNVSFLDGTESWTDAHAPAISADGRCLAFIRNNHVYVLDLVAAASSSTFTPEVLLADLPIGRGSRNFQLDNLEWKPEGTLAPEISSRNISTPTPSGTEYDWRRTKLYLDAPLPDTPTEASLYQLETDQPATIESAHALAQRFDIQGDVYQAPGDLPDTTQLLVTDGKQRLYVRSEQYFIYYADYANYSTDMFSFHEPLRQDEAANYIDGFLKSHGYDFAYQLENAPQLINDYYVVPLSPDGFPLRYDYLMPVRLEIKLDASGQVIFMQSNLIAYEQIGTFGIRTAQEAWERVLDENGAAGTQESMRGAGILKEYFWQRTYPENQTVTIYGRVHSFPPAGPAGIPFISIGDQTVTGNIAGLEAIEGNRLVAASGQFSTENGVRRFQVDSWKVSDAVQTPVSGSLNREGEQFILTTHEGNQYTLADVPSDVPLEAQTPGADLNIDGVLVNGSLEWTSIQYFPADSMHGGGGGGGGLGFYKLNLTGTPVPLPTPQIPQETNPGTGNYVVQEGDTLTAIAESHGISVDELMQLNGLTGPTIFIGQSLVIPGTEQEPSPVGQKIEGQRGILMVNIYRKQDGSQRTEYSFVSSQTNQYDFFRLEGSDLGELEKYHNRPVDIWGTIESGDSSGVVTVKVDRYEVPYPDLQYQILKGTQQLVDVQGQPVVIFTSDNGEAYVQFTGYGDPDSSGIIGNLGDEVLLEALLIPDETFGGYPVVRIMGASMAVNPKTGQPVEMTMTADQPQIIDESQIGPDYTPPTATFEKVELVYYTTDPRYKIPDSASEPAYLQPVWRFYGHYSSGDEFEVLVQALKDEFLLPEVETVQPPG